MTSGSASVPPAAPHQGQQQQHDDPGLEPAAGPSQPDAPPAPPAPLETVPANRPHVPQTGTLDTLVIAGQTVSIRATVNNVGVPVLIAGDERVIVAQMPYNGALELVRALPEHVRQPLAAWVEQNQADLERIPGMLARAIRNRLVELEHEHHEAEMRRLRLRRRVAEAETEVHQAVALVRVRDVSSVPWQEGERENALGLVEIGRDTHRVLVQARQGVSERMEKLTGYIDNLRFLYPADWVSGDEHEDSDDDDDEEGDEDEEMEDDAKDGDGDDDEEMKDDDDVDAMDET